MSGRPGWRNIFTAISIFKYVSSVVIDIIGKLFHPPSLRQTFLYRRQLHYIGILPFILPIGGETLDFIWAPISAYLVHKLYHNPFMTGVAFIEEVTLKMPETV